MAIPKEVLETLRTLEFLQQSDQAQNLLLVAQESSTEMAQSLEGIKAEVEKLEAEHKKRHYEDSQRQIRE